MATVFWDSKEIIMIDYLENGKVINGNLLRAIIERLEGKIAKVALQKSFPPPGQRINHHNDKIERTELGLTSFFQRLVKLPSYTSIFQCKLHATNSSTQPFRHSYYTFKIFV